MADENKFSIHITKVDSDTEDILNDLCSREHRSRRATALLLLESAIMAFWQSGFTSLADWHDKLVQTQKLTRERKKHES
jgi:hypothetical protein